MLDELNSSAAAPDGSAIEKIFTQETIKGLLRAYSRGYFSEAQVIAQLQLSSSKELLILLAQYDIQPWTPAYKKSLEIADKGEISDGFVHYWLSQNPDEPIL